MIRQDFTSMLVLHNAHLIQFTTSHSLWLSSNRWQIFIKYRIIGVYTLKIFTRHSYEINRLGGGRGGYFLPIHVHHYLQFGLLRWYSLPFRLLLSIISSFFWGAKYPLLSVFSSLSIKIIFNHSISCLLFLLFCS